MHGKRILKLLQKIFSWLPLATVIDQKVLVLHGGISDVTDLSILARLDRHNVRTRQCSWDKLFNWYSSKHRYAYTCFNLNQLFDLWNHCTFSQYVSALRPPKKTRQRSTGTSIDSDMDEDVWSSNRIFQRRTSLTFPNPLRARDSFQNRSLQDFSDRIKLTVGEELEFHRKKQSIFHFSRTEKEMSQSASSESFSSDNSKEEWKQVMDKFWAGMFAQILSNRFQCHFICLPLKAHWFDIILALRFVFLSWVSIRLMLSMLDAYINPNSNTLNEKTVK